MLLKIGYLLRGVKEKARALVASIIVFADTTDYTADDTNSLTADNNSAIV